MSTTVDTIARWFQAGVEKKATHMIVVCDTFDYDDYPVYVHADEDALDMVEKRFSGQNMQKVMEVYDLSLDMQQQLQETRAFNY